MDTIGGEYVTFPAKIPAKFGPNEGWTGGDFCDFTTLPRCLKKYELK